MARTKRTRQSAASSELGNGDFGIDFNKHGRAIRSCRTKPRQSPFEDSAVAISDDEDDEIEIGDTISVAPTRKRRKRSPSPALSLPSDQADLLSESDVSGEDDADPAPTPPNDPAGSTIHLTVNIPPGTTGPLTLHLDATLVAAAQRAPAALAKPDRIAQTTLDRLNARSQSQPSEYAGFLDLPAELRNEIYRIAFVSERSVNFAVPDNFDRSAALLRTCHQVHEEGRSILYSENRFTIERRTQRYGSFWENEWKELGYLNVRKFMKTIGQTNTALIRHATFMLEDAVPCLNPAMRTNEERRFVHDDDLMSVLRHMGSHSQLQTLDFHFHGRRRVDRTDDRFLDYMKRIKADKTQFIEWPPQSKYPRRSKQDEFVKTSLLMTCTRKRKKFD